MEQARPRERALVVEDEPMSVMLLVHMLEDSGCDVVIANRGEDALAHVDEVDLVLLDIGLPDIDGYEVAKRIRATERGRSVPIIFVSSYSGAVDKARAFDAGASDYVTKPFDVFEMRARIESRLRVARLQREVDLQRELLRQKDLEIERFVEAIRAREKPLSTPSRQGRITEPLVTRSERAFDRVFTALTEVLPGTVLDKRYRLDSTIGSGAFGVVYQATHLVLDRPIAVKVLQPPRGPEAALQLERFRTEAMSAYRFNHPNAVAVLDASVSSSGLPYIVMELLEGWSLREEIQNAGQIAHRRCTEIMVPVCDVISRAHKAGVTHRDVKPDNIFVSHSGGVETIKVLDFGLARLQAGASGTRADADSGSVAGTPAYMAPECFSGNPPDPEKADVYAIAAVTFEALTGRPPFLTGPGGMAALITQHLMDAPPRPRELAPDIPPLMESLVLAGLEKQPVRRPTAFGEQLIIATLSEGDPLSVQDARTLRLEPLDDE